MSAVESEVLEQPHETPPEGEPAPEPSLREQLESARDTAVARQRDEPPEGRTRGADGKFQRTDAGQPRGRDPQGAQPRVAAKEPAQPADSAGAQPAVAAPQGWKPEVKQHWDGLPDPVKAEINRREADFHKTITAQDQVRSLGSEFMRVANGYAPVIQARGGNPVALFNEFMGILTALHNGDGAQRLAVLRDVAARNGIDPRALSAGAQPGQQPQGSATPALHPAVTQMLREWQGFQRQQQETTARMQRQAQEQYAAELQQANQEIEAFRTQSGHEHFDRVASEMEALLNAGSVTSLEEAYDRAVHANPETRKALTEAAEKQRAAEAQKQREAQRKQRAGGSVRGGGGQPAEAQQGSVGSVRDDLKAALAAAQSRV